MMQIAYIQFLETHHARLPNRMLRDWVVAGPPHYVFDEPAPAAGQRSPNVGRIGIEREPRTPVAAITRRSLTIYLDTMRPSEPATTPICPIVEKPSPFRFREEQHDPDPFDPPMDPRWRIFGGRGFSLSEEEIAAAIAAMGTPEPTNGAGAYSWQYNLSTFWPPDRLPYFQVLARGPRVEDAPSSDG